MTRKLSVSGPSAMDLDLDSFLNLHLSSDDDDYDDLNSVPHRTVDEILNDSDSSSSSSDPSAPPFSISRNSAIFERKPNHDYPGLSKPSSESPEETHKSLEYSKSTQFDEKVGRFRSSSFSLLKHGEVSDDPVRRVSRPLPSLFGGVRSNVKPGAALAAAAAASRSVPTPHAAAIRTRRSMGTADLMKALGSAELSSNAGDDSESNSVELGSNLSGNLKTIGEDINVSVEKSVEDTSVDENEEAFQSAVVDELTGRDGIVGSSSKSVEVLHCTPMENVGDQTAELGQKLIGNSREEFMGASIQPQVDSSSSDVGEGIDFDNKFPVSSTVVDGNRNIRPDYAAHENVLAEDKSSTSFDVHNNIGKDFLPSLTDSDSKGENVGSSTVVEPETVDFLDRVPSSKHMNGVGGVADDASSLSDIDELVEEKIGELETRLNSKRAEKKLRPQMKPLEFAEELEKKHASTGLHWEEGAAAQPMRLEGVRRGSTTLGYFDVSSNNAITRTISSHAFRREHGSAEVLAVHANYIAIGMTRGVIVVVPSKYSAHGADSMDAKMLMLGFQGDRSHAAVTSICFNQQGDLLLAGYGGGHITVWDVQRASVAKAITGEHTAPVVHALFLGQDSQLTRQFKAVTGDSKGLVLLHTFSVVPLLNRFSIKTQCLLDGQKTGIVLSASPLLPDEFSGGASLTSQGSSMSSAASISGMMGGMVGGDAGWKLFNEGSSFVEEGVVIFVTHQNALVARLSPLELYAQFSRPDGAREGSVPCTAWKCTSQSPSSSTENMPSEASEKISLLAIAWDRKVQVAKFVKSELKVYGRWSLDSAAIGVAWLDDQMLVILTVSAQLYLFAKDGTVIHQTNFALDGSILDDLVSYHTHFLNIFGNPEKAFHNSVAVRGASVYVLGPAHLIVSRLLPWKERIQVLRGAGDWMGALNMALTIYDGQAHGVVDLPRTLDAVQVAIMPYLVELLLSYVQEVFSYISVAFCNQIGKMDQSDDPASKNNSVHNEIKEQYTRVGGVAVEFCVHIKRTDVLFEDIFSKFIAVQRRDTFLELLEPYVLRDMLGSLPPEIMQALVEHYSSKGWLQRVEQCVLHMDISSLDFNQVVKLCREHGLYGALIYLFNSGLDDFRTPLEELFMVFQNSYGEGAFEIGYRMLVYLKYCFSGLAFPPGQGALPPSRLPSLRTELLQFLLEDSATLKLRAVSSLTVRGAYLNLCPLLELDTEATLNVVRCALVEDDEIPNLDLTSHNLADENLEGKREKNSVAGSDNILVQSTVDVLTHILEENISHAHKSSKEDSGSMERWQSKKEIAHLVEFIAYYVACGRARVSKSVLGQILDFLTSKDNLPSNGSSKRREKQVLALLKVMPETDWVSSDVLNLCEKAHFYQVCGLIHTMRHQYIAALDNYIKDLDEPLLVFSFIEKKLIELSENENSTFQSAVISRIPELVNLHRESAFFLVIVHFNDEESNILSKLRSHPRSLFLYLKTVIEAYLSGTLNFNLVTEDNIISTKDKSDGLEAYLNKIANFPKFLRNNPIHINDDLIELYLELLCQYEPDSALKFLETFDSYRVEHCLRLCQEYGIIDAAAFLLERVGDVGSALLLTLSSFNDKFIKLDTAVRSIAVSNKASHAFAGTDYFNTILKLEEVNEIGNTLQACIGLCQRNTPRLNPEEAETLWFKLLDSFCEPLMASYREENLGDGENLNGVLAESSRLKEDEEVSIIKWRIPKAHKGAHILRKLFSEFIKDIVERMIGYVCLPTIMTKLLSDNGSQEFGDFKLTILGMLGTYGFERRILDTAKSLIEDDTYYTMSLLKKGASHGYAPRSQLCCICNCPLAKNSSGSGIRVFSCGHATHLQCEVLENGGTSVSGPSGCPVCMPNKKIQKPRNKLVLEENGLVKSYSSRPQRVQGTSSHSHENDALDYANALQQISRFEILTNLEREQKLVQIEKIPQLRLAPPAVYHEKVNKGADLLAAESSHSKAKTEKQSRNKQLKDLKVKGSSSLRFPLRSNIFGKEKIIKK